MSKRIYYNQLPNKIKESNTTFKSESTGATYKVRLDFNDFSYTIKNVGSGHLIKPDCSGVHNENYLKRKAKAHLERLGVRLGREIRNRSFGRCEKGHNQEKELNKRGDND